MSNEALTFICQINSILIAGIIITLVLHIPGHRRD